MFPEKGDVPFKTWKSRRRSLRNLKCPVPVNNPLSAEENGNVSCKTLDREYGSVWLLDTVDLSDLQRQVDHCPTADTREGQLLFSPTAVNTSEEWPVLSPTAVSTSDCVQRTPSATADYTQVLPSPVTADYTQVLPSRVTADYTQVLPSRVTADYTQVLPSPAEGQCHVAIVPSQPLVQTGHGVAPDDMTMTFISTPETVRSGTLHEQSLVRTPVGLFEDENIIPTPRKAVREDKTLEENCSCYDLLPKVAAPSLELHNRQLSSRMPDAVDAVVAPGSSLITGQDCFQPHTVIEARQSRESKKARKERRRSVYGSDLILPGLAINIGTGTTASQQIESPETAHKALQHTDTGYTASQRLHRPETALETVDGDWSGWDGHQEVNTVSDNPHHPQTQQETCPVPSDTSDSSSNSSYDTEHGTKGHSTEHGTKGHSTEHGTKGHSTEHDAKGHDAKGHDTEYDTKGHGTERGTKGHDTKHGTKGHDTEYDTKGHDTEHGTKGHDTEHDAKGHDTEYDAKGHDTEHGTKGQMHTRAPETQSRKRKRKSVDVVLVETNMAASADDTERSLACPRTSKRRSSLRLYKHQLYQASATFTHSEGTESCEHVDNGDCGGDSECKSQSAQQKPDPQTTGTSGSIDTPLCLTQGEEVCVHPQVESLYKNKNYKKPGVRSWETIFEHPSTGKLTSKLRLRRYVQFEDIPVSKLKRRLRKAALNGWCASKCKYGDNKEKELKLRLEALEREIQEQS